MYDVRNIQPYNTFEVKVTRLQRHNVDYQHFKNTFVTSVTSKI